MSRRAFVLCFVGMASLFVPVIFFFGLSACIAPAAYGVPMLANIITVKKILRLNPLMIAWWTYLLIYLGLYYGLARGIYRAIAKCPDRGTRLSLQCAVLFAIFSCSFLRVLTYSSIQGSGGTYTFWGAIERAIEKGWL